MQKHTKSHQKLILFKISIELCAPVEICTVVNQSSKWKFEFTSPNLFLYTGSSLKKKNPIFTGPNKVVLVLGRKTGAHSEDWKVCCKVYSGNKI
jgi:hypothetical protein